MTPMVLPGLVLVLACRSEPTDPQAPSTTPRPAVDTARGATGGETAETTGSTGSTGPTGPTGHSGDSASWSGEPTASPYVLRTGPPPDNVLLISIDTTRADHVNSNGYTGATTSPHVDALLARGLALRDHRSCSSWTMASFLCALTGQDQVTLGHWPDNNRGGKGLLPYPHDDLPSLAWRLQSEGFATHLVTANTLISVNFNMDRGFDEVTRTFVAPETADAGIEALGDLVAGPERWFLHVHFMAPHTPYDPDPAFLDPATSCPGHDLTTVDGFRAWTRDDTQPEADRAACLEHTLALYDALIAETDHHIGRLLAALEETGQAEQTAIMFLTDHGEGFGEHDDWEHGFGHYEHQVRSTAGVVYPPRIAPAEHAGLTRHEDLLPTLLTVLDEAVPDELTGVPIGAADVPVVHHLTYRNTETVQSVTTATDKLSYTWDGTLSYYDLVADPEEAHDRYAPELPRVQILWRLLQPRIDDLAGQVTDGSEPIGLPDDLGAPPP